ncbi:hypothetical protein AYI69_g2200 [Smittium culicis]|uniref:Uncharacterized protein n=1 Tax=Smittium culicis TaxID=133412 RepID=A0A1R1YN53_9FUNG|nr:hypothetical protein AYI69_g2200 [Smittium culicis]
MYFFPFCVSQTKKKRVTSTKEISDIVVPPDPDPELDECENENFHSFYQEFSSVFSKNLASTLPDHRKYDCPINLKTEYTPTGVRSTPSPKSN